MNDHLLDYRTQLHDVMMNIHNNVGLMVIHNYMLITRHFLTIMSGEKVEERALMVPF